MEPNTISEQDFRDDFTQNVEILQENYSTLCNIVLQVTVRETVLATGVLTRIFGLLYTCVTILLYTSIASDYLDSYLDTSSQLMESQSQGYCSYTQPQLQCDNNKLPCGSDDECRRQGLEDVICDHTSFMNKSD